VIEVAPAPLGSREASSGSGPDRPVRSAGERWSRWLIWLGAAVLVIAVARNVREAWEHHARLRALRCDRPVYDFGRAFQGDVLEHTFHVVNLGRQPITIERVTAACGCTTLRRALEGMTVAPQGEFDVPVRLDLASVPLGKAEKPVVVKFAGAPPLQLTLKLRGTVVPEWSWSPRSVVFQGIGTGEVVSETIVLTQHPEASPAEIGHVAVPPLLRAEVAPAGDEGGRAWRLTLSTVPPLPPGRRDLDVYASRADGRSLIGPIRVTLIVDE
jgi:hypothetical protein